ncbi:ATP-grasp domain-containing protein [Bacteroides pyogenes]|uniref:ATP-binding protein n=1 Tax=Bacteroides pyogenes TaxID=310300 RepID=UPI002FDAC353
MSILKGKRLLVQGAGRGNLGIVQSAKKYGVFTAITGMGGDYPCTPLADVNCYANIADPDAVLKVAQEQKVDGAVICCSDTGLKAIGRVNDVMGLIGLTEKSADESSNKFLMKERLVEAGVRTAQFYRLHNEEELKVAVEKIGYPLIIKATDLQGSRGICIVREESLLLSAFNEVMSLTHKDYCIIEEFLIGEEYGAQSFVYHGEVLFVLPHGDETMMCKTAVPVGHYMPYKMSDALYEDTCLQVKNAIKALDFDNCPVNVDLIECGGKAYIIELTGRVGANCLPELTGNYFGINYYDMILHTCLGESPLPIFEQKQAPSATLARMVRSDKAGIAKSISVPELPDTEILMFIHERSKVCVFTNCNDAIGQVIVKGKDMAECEEKMKLALSKIEISYE